MPKGTSKSTAIIQRLLEERRQYEAWLARLNDSADATPGHVRALVRNKPIPPPPTRAPATAPPAPPARPRAQPQPPLQPEATPHEDELAFIKSVTEDDKTAPSPRRASGAQFQPVIPADTPTANPN